MIDRDRRIKVYCTVDHRVYMVSPVTKRKYVIEKGVSQNAYARIPFEELEAILMTTGGRKLYEKYLIIKDKDVLLDLNLEDKTVAKIDTLSDALKNKNMAQLKRYLIDIDEESKLKLVKLAVEMQLKDLEKIVLIKQETGYDILTPILNGETEFEVADTNTKEEKKVSSDLDFDLDSLLKDELKEIAKEMDINVGSSKKATIIEKLEEADKEKAIELAKKLD